MENEQMNDKQAIEVLKKILEKYPLTEEEKEGVRSAIGILAWTKLIDGWKDQKKKARDRKMQGME